MVNDLVRGAISGVVGTTLMSEILAFAKSAGFFPDEIPHKQIVENAAEKVGVADELSGGAMEATWITQHFIYGTVAGSVYGLVQNRLKLPGALVPASAVFGLALWAIGFGGWAPLAGLYPGPTEDQPRKQGAEIFAHLVYAGVTATMFWMLNKARQSKVY